MEDRDLDSWKAIATYLKVSVRTAQLWEQDRGLPVHRVGKMPKPRIRANTRELRLWLEKQELGGPDDGPGNRLSARRRFALTGGLILLVAAFSVTSLLFISSRGAAPNRYSYEDHSFRAFDQNGRVLWTRQFPKVDFSCIPLPYKPTRFEVTDIDGDNRNEILFNYLPESAIEPGQLICLDDQGRDRWTFRYGGRPSTNAAGAECCYRGFSIRSFDIGGVRYVVAVSCHTTGPISQVALLDPVSGRLLHEYRHPGWLTCTAAADVDNDSGPELLLGGVNNPGPGYGFPALLAVDVPFVSERTSRPKGHFSELTGDAEIDYLLLPRPEDAVFGAWIVTELAVGTNDSILAVISAGQLSLHAYLTPHFEVVKMVATDVFVANHHFFFLKGLLDHPFEQSELNCWPARRFDRVPDGNSSEVRKLMASICTGSRNQRTRRTTQNRLEFE